jgi:hypothetical protein
MVHYVGGKDACSMPKKKKSLGCQSLPKFKCRDFFPDWLYGFPYRRSCSGDREQRSEMSPIQQMLSPSRKEEQKPTSKDKTKVLLFQPKHVLPASNSLLLYI